MPPKHKEATILNKNITFTDRVSSSEKCKLTKDGLLFQTMYDLKEFIDEILIEAIQKDAASKINRGFK